MLKLTNPNWDRLSKGVAIPAAGAAMVLVAATTYIVPSSAAGPECTPGHTITVNPSGPSGPGSLGLKAHAGPSVIERTIDLGETMEGGTWAVSLDVWDPGADDPDTPNEQVRVEGPGGETRYSTDIAPGVADPGPEDLGTLTTDADTSSITVRHIGDDDWTLDPIDSVYLQELVLSCTTPMSAAPEPTSAPSTQAPVTTAAPTPTDAPDGTQAPGTQVPGTQVPGTQVPGTQAPGTQAPGTQAPGTQAPATQAPGTQAPGTQAPGTQAPGTQAPVDTMPPAPTTVPAPATSVPAPVSSVAPTTVPAPATTVPAPVTSAPPTTAAGDNCEPGTRSSKVQTPGGEFTLVATTPACEAYAGFNVNGRIGVDAADGDSAAIVYVVDLSGSTGSSDDLDCNGDGTFNDGDKFVGSRNGGTILDCEVAGIIALNDSLAGSNTRVGLVGFGASAAAADVSPAGGTQLFTSPTADVNNDGQRDIETVARSLRGARINEFGGSTNVGFLTDFESALDASIAALDTVDADQKVIFFLSDGNSNDGVDQARTAAGKGIVINTYGVGAGASECGDNDRLGDFARITNGKCTNVVDPSGLSTTLIAAVPVGVDRVEVTVDGGAVRPATLDALGNWSVGTFDVPDGVHTVEATAFTDDGSSTSIEFGILKMAPAA